MRGPGGRALDMWGFGATRCVRSKSQAVFIQDARHGGREDVDRHRFHQNRAQAVFFWILPPELAEAAQQDDRESTAPAPDPIGELESGHSRHRLIRDDEIERRFRLRQNRRNVRRYRRLHNIVAHARQHARKELGDHRVIVDHKNTSFASHLTRRRRLFSDRRLLFD